MSDLMPCPICHNRGTHKMDCQNAAYVREKDKRIKKLEEAGKKVSASLTKSINKNGELCQRIAELQAKLDAVRNLCINSRVLDALDILAALKEQQDE